MSAWTGTIFGGKNWKNSNMFIVFTMSHRLLLQ
ncbi:unnamed protein product [Enterobius vermicularis]|uniref:Uncharacterized protein n=1 Tax=Enterobius vermicularis TaxID=51028 RepID=A0A0N4V5Y7_ENTVE|nr:unnamed protein product [Enterobius vermicularis]